MITYRLPKYLLAFILLLIGYQVIAQIKRPISEPPTLKNGQHLGSYLRLGYHAPVDSFLVITIKFKISAGGFLDTLYISENAPASFIKAAHDQLIKLNGQWNPQLVNSKPTQSKWLLSRFYIGGLRKDNSVCIRKQQREFLDAFKREEALFLCDKKVNPPLKCLIDYVEGYDCYLYPPLLSNTES